LADAITNQQKDVLEAIQQLRQKAVANGVIKTDDKVKVSEDNDNIVIQPASPEVVYVPQYEPAMLYDDDYPPAPIYYYPDPYPPYYYPGAPFFAGFVTGAIWGAVVDWDDWGVWGGGGWGNDIDIDCNNCFNNINGKVKLNDVDWKNVNRNDIKFDKNQLSKIDRNEMKRGLENNNRNNISNKARDVQKNRPSTLPAGKGGQVKDVRASTLEGLKAQPGNKMAKPGQGGGPNVVRPGQGGGAVNKGPGAKVDRPVGKAKPAAKVDNRPKNPSPLGEVNRGQTAKAQSNRGGKSMGGGTCKTRPGGCASSRPRPQPHAGGGGRRGGGGGGGRGRR
jgi:hypothetical protein